MLSELRIEQVTLVLPYKFIALYVYFSTTAPHISIPQLLLHFLLPPPYLRYY